MRSMLCVYTAVRLWMGKAATSQHKLLVKLSSQSIDHTLSSSPEELVTAR